MSDQKSDKFTDNADNYDKINLDVLALQDKVRNIKDDIRRTPWYHVFAHLKLHKEYKNLVKEADKIGERLKKLDRDLKLIEIVKRI